MYKRAGKEDQFFQLKPTLTDRQVLLSNAFYRLSQERESCNGAPMPIKDRDIHYYQKHNGSHGYADDLFLFAIHEIDNDYIKAKCEELSRKNKAK